MLGLQPPKKNIEDLYEVAQASVAAETLLATMRPQLEKAFELKLNILFDAPPELGALLDARAQIKAIYDMRISLQRDAKKGKKAVEMFSNLLIKSEVS